MLLTAGGGFSLTLKLESCGFIYKALFIASSRAISWLVLVLQAIVIALPFLAFLECCRLCLAMPEIKTFTNHDNSGQLLNLRYLIKYQGQHKMFRGNAKTRIFCFLKNKREVQK